MLTFKQLLERVKENELTLSKFHYVESKIISILNFKDFFETLLSEIKSQFDIPYVWISLIEGSELSELVMKHSDNSPILQERINRISISRFRGLMGEGRTPRLINSDMKAYMAFLPGGNRFAIRSMAVTPLFLDGKLIGSLNQADSSIDRYEPDLDTSLLEQLGLKISLCLSNVTAHEKLKFLAYHDPLTQLLNRRVLESVLKREFYRSKRYDEPLSCVFIDLNYFKVVNDTYGHDCGDLLLQFVAETLTAESRESDTVSRFAGDEFVIVLPGTGKEESELMLARMTKRFDSTHLKYKGKRLKASISYGIASTEDKHITDPETLMKEADQLLYEKKRMNRTGR